MILNTALKVIVASTLVLGPAGAAATGANGGGTRKDVRGGGGKQVDDEADVRSIIRKLQEEVAQLKHKARHLNTDSDITEDAPGVNDPHGSLDLCETADLLHGINARTGNADLTDHTHDIDLEHDHPISQENHSHPIGVDHSHNLTLPEIECTCTYKYAQKETTEIQTETWAGPTSTGGGQAEITIEDALSTAETTGPSNKDLTHLHDLTDLLLGLDDAGTELSYAATSYGSDTCNTTTPDVPRYPGCTNLGTCDLYTPCNPATCGSAERGCYTTIFGDGLCATEVFCDEVKECPGGQSECDPDEVCVVDTCCAIFGFEANLCVPSSNFCGGAGSAEIPDVEGANDGRPTSFSSN